MPKRPTSGYQPLHADEARAARPRPPPQPNLSYLTPLVIVGRAMRESERAGDHAEALRLALILLPYRHPIRGKAAPVRKDASLGEGLSQSDADLAEAIAAAQRGRPR